MIDVTNEYDVSDEVQNHDSMNESNVGVSLDESSDAIHIRSMDGNTYLMDRNAIDWDSTSNNMGIMNQNLEMIQNYLMDLMFSQTQSADIDSDGILNIVEPFVHDFGLHPKYDQIYTDASKNLIATLYCIDAIELLHTMLREVHAWMASKAGECLFQIMQESNNQQEETKDEN